MRGGGFPGIGRGGSPAGLKMETVDADGDGKVTRAELAAYYRKNGFTPFQFNLSAGGQNPLARMRPCSAARSRSLRSKRSTRRFFELLDTNKDGKLTLKQLEAAESVLVQMDENEDEIVHARELVPNTVTRISWAP